MRRFLHDMRREFGRGRGPRRGRTSINSALSLLLLAYVPAGLAVFFAVPTLSRVLHWTIAASLGGGIALGFFVLIAVSRWFQRKLDRP